MGRINKNGMSFLKVLPCKLIDDSKVVLPEIVSLNFSNSDSMYIRFSSKGGKKARAISPMSAIHSTHMY